MEHINIITKIIETERLAQEIANEARARKEHLPEQLADERNKLHDDFFARAQRRISIVAEREESIAQEQCDRLDEKLAADLKTIDATASEKREMWVSRLFDSIIGN